MARTPSFIDSRITSLTLLAVAFSGSVRLSAAVAASIVASKATYMTGETIHVSFSIGSVETATALDWISVTDRGKAPPSILWQYVCGGQSACTLAVQSSSVQFNADALSSGDYDVTYFANDGYSALAGPAEFSVNHLACMAATSAPYPKVHTLPTENTQLSVVAFSSCYKPAAQTSDTLWRHMRHNLSAELWLWLGDNMYADGVDMEYKRLAYRTARSNEYYLTQGPMADPVIPVMATWDDHDASSNNDGSGYGCVLQSQNEFAIHFGIPSSDPRHQDQGSAQQVGVYSSTMFARPADFGGGNGIHVIMLDARTGRDPTFSDYGTCRQEKSKMLNESQWEWLDTELQRHSEVKIIGSGIQVLPPTDLSGRDSSAYCAYDGASGSFDQAVADVGESASSLGTGKICISIT